MIRTEDNEDSSFLSTDILAFCRCVCGVVIAIDLPYFSNLPLFVGLSEARPPQPSLLGICVHHTTPGPGQITLSGTHPSRARHVQKSFSIDRVVLSILHCPEIIVPLLLSEIFDPDVSRNSHPTVNRGTRGRLLIARRLHVQNRRHRIGSSHVELPLGWKVPF